MGDVIKFLELFQRLLVYVEKFLWWKRGLKAYFTLEHPTDECIHKQEAFINHETAGFKTKKVKSQVVAGKTYFLNGQEVTQGHKCKDSEELSELDLSTTALHIIGALTGAGGEAVVERVAEGTSLISPRLCGEAGRAGLVGLTAVLPALAPGVTAAPMPV